MVFGGVHLTDTLQGKKLPSMSVSPGKHPETQEMRAERDCKAVERLLSCQACKRKPSMAEHPGKRIASMFLTNTVREMAAFRQKGCRRF